MTKKQLFSAIPIMIFLLSGIMMPGCGTDDGSVSLIQKPSGVTAVTDGADIIRLSWIDNSDNETGFAVEQRQEGSAYEEVGLLSENTEAFTATGLSASTAYYFRVRAFNDQGYSGYSEEVTGTTEGDSDYLAGDEMAPWEGGPAYYARWENGPSDDPSVFPVAVWLQRSENATAYKEIGINHYVGQYNGPTEAQLISLTDSVMPVFCTQNDVALSSENSRIIKAWMQQDEPDNAQNGSQDPVSTEEIINRYKTMVAADPTRPVYLNLGQGVAADSWYGRGNRTGHPEDYEHYVRGADILSFDIYPMNIYPRPVDDPPWFTAFDNGVSGKIWYVAAGVDRLREYTDYQKPVWAWIECTNIGSNENYALTPVHVKAEVWMAVIHGARGIGYFTHVFTESGDYVTDSGLLSNPEMKAAVSGINAQITTLAPVLNTQSVGNGVTAVSDNPDIPVDTMVKRSDGFTYVFAVAMRPGAATATFTLRGFRGAETIEVVGENRTVSADEGVFQDDFSNYAVHIYKVATP